MAAQPSPVTPEVVQWALGEDGRSLAEIADALKIDRERLEDWMTGDVAPSTGEVTRLSKVLRRPRALFFLPRAPRAATLPASFRHPPGEDRAVGAEARRRVRQARRLQHAVSWALRDGPSVDVPRAAGTASPTEAAEAARSWLGVGTDDLQWSNERAALRFWREAIEERGILVFALEVGRDDVRGFSAWDDHAPLIVVNVSGVAPVARTFTLAHELGHLVRRQDAACAEPLSGEPALSPQVERWCERFAAALLMPEDAVRLLARARGLSDAAADIDDVRAVTYRFRVSARAAALRLIDLGYATRALYTRVEATFVPTPTRESSGNVRRAPRAVARVREYGPRTIRTVLGALPSRDALSVLRVTVEDVRRIAEEVPGVRVP